MPPPMAFERQIMSGVTPETSDSFKVSRVRHAHAEISNIGFDEQGRYLTEVSVKALHKCIQIVPWSYECVLSRVMKYTSRFDGRRGRPRRAHLRRPVRLVADKYRIMTAVIASFNFYYLVLSRICTSKS